MKEYFLGAVFGLIGILMVAELGGLLVCSAIAGRYRTIEGAERLVERFK